MVSALGNKGGINLVVSYETAVKMLALRQKSRSRDIRRRQAHHPDTSVVTVATSHTLENSERAVLAPQDPTAEALLGECPTPLQKVPVDAQQLL